MRKMEAEAYLKGNMIFRDWEDEAKSTNKFIKLKFIGENNMSSINKIKDLIKDRVLEIIEEKKKKKPDADGDGVPDWADKKPGKDDHAEKQDKPKKKAKKGEIPRQFRKHVKGRQDKEEDLDEVAASSLARYMDAIPRDEDEAKNPEKAEKRAREAAKSQEKKKKKSVEEGGAAQRHDNLDRLRRQDADRIKEEDEEKKSKKKSEKKPESDEERINRLYYNDPMPAHRKKKLGEGNKSPKDKDGKNRYVKHPDKEGVHGVVTAVTDKRTSVRYSDGTQRSHDNMERLAKSTEKAYKDARKTKKESASELTDRKAEQSSINHLNEQRLLKLNKRLIEKLIK